MANTATDAPSRNGAADEPTGSPTFELRRLERVTFEVAIVGTAPLIVHRWSEKAKRLMLEASQTKAKSKREPRDPVADFEASRYRLADGRDGFPAVGFKAAIVHAGRLFDKSLTQVALKQSMYVKGEGSEMLVPLLCPDGPTMREDTVRVGMGTADLRYRASYWPWFARVQVQTVAGQFDLESVYALVDAAGIGGVGEWRPTAPKSATGSYGTFEVVAEEDLPNV